MQTTVSPSGAQPSSELSRIAQDLQIRKVQVEAVVQLLDEGNTVPFITRYRKERTGGLNEEIIRRIQARVTQARQLNDRKQTILKSIEAQNKLSDDLRNLILAAESSKRLEDLYLPFKPKRTTLASAARDKGLEPLALALWNRDPAVDDLDNVVTGMVDPEKQLNSVEEIMTGVGHILAEMISETADVRGVIRLIINDIGKVLSSKVENVAEGQGQEFRDYFQFSELVKNIPPHRILAVNRGEREKILNVRIDADAEIIRNETIVRLPQLADHPRRDYLLTVVDDAIERLLLPSLKNEVRRELTERAQDHAVSIFARNLRSLLLQPPLRGSRVLAIDPGQRSGCKIAVLDETGKLLNEGVIFPHPPQKRTTEAKLKLEEWIRKYQTRIIAIGNGTACRETEQLIADLIAEFEEKRKNNSFSPTIVIPVHQPKARAANPAPASAPATETPATDDASAPAAPSDAAPSDATPSETPAPVAETPPSEPPAEPTVPPPPPLPPVPPAPEPEPLPLPPEDLAYVIVNEAGASDYSASPIAKEEFPNFDATTRGTISIGRRLQDPLSELVKIDPQHVGVGLYQHDVKAKHLKESLEGVVESCVNYVGVDLNTASVPLLRHVSGLNAVAAREIVDYRTQNGPFRTREQLIQVPQIGEARFKQAAGFLKILDGDDPLDVTWIHPESYTVARQILADLGFTPADLSDREKLAQIREKLPTLSVPELAAKLTVGEPTVADILEAIARPGRDPREDLPPPIFKKGILKLEDLQPQMELKGTVLNVVDFGAFVDIGLKDSGLVHISQMANRYIKSPYDVVAVGDVVTVWVLQVDSDRRRVSLTMIAPGTERKPPERGPRGDRGERGGDGPPRGDRPQGDRGPRFGGRPQGDRPQGDRPQGDRPQGDRPRFGGGDRPQGGGRPFRGGPGRQPAVQGEGGRPGEGSPRPPMQPPKPKPPKKNRPLPTLTQAALTGKAPLHTFGELEAFFKAKDPAAPPEEPKPTPTEEGKSETPPPPSDEVKPTPANDETPPPANDETPPTNG